MTETISPPVPEGKITLDRERTFRADVQGMRLFKRETVTADHPNGISILKNELKADLLDEDLMVTLLWAFLVHEDPELTIDAVASMLSLTTLVNNMELMLGLIAEAMPEPKGTEPDEEGTETDPLEVDDEEAPSTS